MKQLVFFLLTAFCMIGCYAIQDYPNRPITVNNNFLGEPGKCYAKCIVSETHLETQEKYAVYTGTDPQNTPSVSKQSILIKEYSKEWVKKKADKNCLSADPDDCLVWCLVESPAQYIETYIVKDTIVNKQFEYRRITSAQSLSPTGKSEFKEVLCTADVTHDVLTDLQLKLSELGFYTASVSAQFDDITQEALRAYQRSEGLPIGNLNIETLDELGLSY